MISYADLGGLGAREGTPVVCTWEPPPPEPPQMPVAIAAGCKSLFWLLILLTLFLPRQNRTPEAWWLWLPILASALVVTGLVCLTSDKEWALLQAACSFVVGLAAVWLLMPFLESRSRIGAFFKTLPVLAGFSLLAFVPTLLAQHSGWLDFRPYLAAMLALGSLAATLALVFTGLSVRRQFGRIRFIVWLAAWMVLAWTAIAIPAAIIGAANGGNNWREGLLAILSLSAVSLGMVLPLVLLSFFLPFYRGRFFGWLNLPQSVPNAGMAVPTKIPGVYQPEATATAGIVQK